MIEALTIVALLAALSAGTACLVRRFRFVPLPPNRTMEEWGMLALQSVRLSGVSLLRIHRASIGRMVVHGAGAALIVPEWPAESALTLLGLLRAFQPATRRTLVKALRSGLDAAIDVTLRTQDGTRVLRARRLPGATRDRSAWMIEDMTAQHEALDVLAQRQSDHALLMELAPVGIALSTDAGCERVVGNATLRQQFDAGSGDNLSATSTAPDDWGPRIRYAVSGKDIAPHDLPLQAAAREARPVGPVELEIEMPDGRRWVAETRAAPILNEAGRVVRALAVTVDVTARRNAEAALREADRRKDAFLAMLAHELRNPLAPLRTAASLLARADMEPEKLGWCAGVVERQVEVMVRLLDDLSDLSRIRHGRLELRRRRTDLRRVLERAVESQTPAAERAGHAFQVALPEAEICVDADALRLQQVFANLIGNAIRYSPKPDVIAIDLSADGEHARVKVKDNGMGIEPVWLPKLFDLYSRSPEAEHNAPGGLGIGLALVQELLIAHGGRVVAHSEGPGRGSEFSVWLPALPCEETVG